MRSPCPCDVHAMAMQSPADVVERCDDLPVHAQHRESCGRRSHHDHHRCFLTLSPPSHRALSPRPLTAPSPSPSPRSGDASPSFGGLRSDAPPSSSSLPGRRHASPYPHPHTKFSSYPLPLPSRPLTLSPFLTLSHPLSLSSLPTPSPSPRPVAQRQPPAAALNLPLAARSRQSAAHRRGAGARALKPTTSRGCWPSP